MNGVYKSITCISIYSVFACCEVLLATSGLSRTSIDSTKSGFYEYLELGGFSYVTEVDTISPNQFSHYWINDSTVEPDRQPHSFNDRFFKMDSKSSPDSIVFPLPSRNGIIHSHRFKNKAKTYGDMFRILINSIEYNGYDDFDLILLKNGFAIVTPCECMKENGESKKFARWSCEKNPLEINSLGQFARYLIGGAPTYFRRMVFIVSTEPPSLKEDVVDLDELDNWAQYRVGILPEYLLSKDYNAYVSVLIYEYKSLFYKAELNRYSGNSAIGHIRKSGILEWL